MSGFLQRLVVRSRPSSTDSMEQVVHPRLGSRFEPAVGVPSQVPTIDVPRHDEAAVSAESVPPSPEAPGDQSSRQRPVRTIRPSSPAVPSRHPVPPAADSVEQVQAAGTVDHDTARSETPALPESVRPSPPPARYDTASSEEPASRGEHRYLPVRDVQPTPSGQPSTPAPPPERAETVITPTPAAQEVVRTVRVVHDTSVSENMGASESELPAVQPMSIERYTAAREPETEEQLSPPHMAQPAVDRPEQPVRVRTDRPAEPIRPQVIGVPAPAEPAVPRGRRQPAEPATIRVTIGRIEVRAERRPPAAPPQTRRQPARRTPALSLDDYLAQRNEGGR